ncbi:hypothetical protein BJ508DRAFT_8862 [Ascobolus immersus RN42]|uniref:Uncharacterized protein n=1 Tax=Ascobolus immersus RN42 TaxID=1160509 RepID=A0A3N4HWW7_ASCIM|nr:hypothetical protein BJ508DRAFT_8862 [Ascobolus immersus RN42]
MKTSWRKSRKRSLVASSFPSSTSFPSSLRTSTTCTLWQSRRWRRQQRRTINACIGSRLLCIICEHYLYDVMDRRYLSVSHGEKMIDCFWYPIIDCALAATRSYYLTRGELQSQTMRSVLTNVARNNGLSKSLCKFDGIFKNFETENCLESTEYGFTETSRTKILDWNSKLIKDERKILKGATFILDAAEVKRLDDSKSGSESGPLVDVDVGHGTSLAVGLVATGLALRISILVQRGDKDVRILHRRKPVELLTHYDPIKARAVLVEGRVLAHLLDHLKQ